MTKSIFKTAATIQSLRAQHVETERDRQFTLQLSRLFQVGGDGQPTSEPVRFTAGTETHGIIFIEGSGGGKTTAILDVLRHFEPLLENPETGAPRYLHMKVESPATLRSLGSGILQKLGIDKIAERAKVYEIWEMVRHRIQLMGITLLWIDEAHDMFRAAASSETDNMFKMLKSLMQGDHPVVLVLSGTERLSDITSLDPQVNRRFNKIRPAPLAFGTDNRRVEKLIKGYAAKAGLGVALEDDQVNRLIYASRYRFGRCIETIIYAIECALMDGADTLRMEHFEVAWGQQEGCEVTRNVFAASHWLEIDLDDEDGLRESRETPSAKKRTRKKKAA